MKPWQLGDGDNTVATEQLRMEFIFDSINRQLASIGVTDQTTFDAFANYIGYSTGGTPSYQDMQVAWTPSNLKLGQILGFITNFDTTTSLPGIQTLSIEYATVRDAIMIQSASDLLSVVFPSLVTCAGDAEFTIKQCPLLTTITANSLVTVAGFGLTIASNPSLASIGLNSLVSVLQSGMQITGSSSLTTLNLPSLVNVPGGINCANNTALVTVSIPLLTPANGDVLTFSGCALSTASVDHILAVCVAAAGFTAGTIVVNGGTSSPPSSTAPGSDYAVLVARGVSVFVNP